MTRSETKTDFAAWAIAALGAAISVTPRIPLPIVIGGTRILDIRLEDILLSVLLFGGLIYLLLNGRFRFPLALPWCVYLGSGLLSSALGMAFYGANPAKTFFYNLKEFEYLLIFLFAANFIKNEESVKKVLYALMAFGAANILWGLSQAIGWAHGPLFILELTGPAIEIKGGRFGHYGVTTLGETSPFSTALYFAFISYLFYSFAKFGGGRVIFIGAAGAAASLCSFMSGEKIAVVLFLLALAAFNAGKFYTPPRLFWAAATLTFFIFLISNPVTDYHTMVGYFQNNTSLGKRYPAIGRILHTDGYILGPGRSNERWQQWTYMTENKAGTVLLGSGKSNMYLYEERPTEEAHSHYVKTYIETGIIGLLAFFYLAANILVRLKSVADAESIYFRTAGLTSLLILGALMVAGLVQDSFKPVLPNVFFWLLAGLTYSSVLNRKKTPEPPE